MLNKKPGIYLLIIKSPKKTYKYVGQSINVSNRVSQHKNCLKKNKHYNKYLQRVYNKHCKSIKDLIVEFINYEEPFLNIVEQTWINIIQTQDCVCLNQFPAKAQRGYKLSKEHCKKISERAKKSPAVQASIRKAGIVSASKPRSKRQLEVALTLGVPAMNTPEANAKAVETRKTSLAWKQGRIECGKKNRGNQYAFGKTRGTDNGNADHTIYVFQHKKSKEIYTLTRSDLISRIQNVRPNKPKPRLANLISGKEKSAYGYKLLSCPLHK